MTDNTDHRPVPRSRPGTVVALWAATAACVVAYAVALVRVEGPLWVSVLGVAVVTLSGMSAAITWPAAARWTALHRPGPAKGAGID